MKEVDIDTLRADYPLEYEKQYADWAQSQCDIVCETALDDLRDCAEFELHGTGWHVTDSVNYQLAFSQGDGVAIDSTVYYDELNEATLDELRQDFPMCLELLGRDYLHVWSICAPRNVRSVIKWELDTMQEDEDHEDFDGCVYRLEGGIYDGLPESVAFQIAEAEDFDRFADDLGDRLCDAEQRVYKRLRDNVEFQTSEDMFIEWARDFDVRFDVEE